MTHNPIEPLVSSIPINEEEKLNWVKLSLVPKLGSQTFCQLLRTFGLPENILGASTSQLSSVVKSKVASAIKQAEYSEQLALTKAWLAEANNHLITLADPQYPKALFEISETPPPLLYAKGDLNLLNQPCIAMVGGRNATQQGIQNAEQFSKDLSLNGLSIVSGMALGIDGAAHRGALAGSGKTIAVVGTGLDIVYPAKHRQLAHDIVQTGLILSEFPLGTPSIASNFPRRNRIISGLSMGCLVVEANTKSGSLITAKLAAEQGREVFAIPGSIHSPMAKGCHLLIKQGAKLVESTQDILDELGRFEKVNSTEASAQANIVNTNSDDSDPLLAFIEFAPTSLESIVQKSGLPTQTVTASLMLLALDNKIEQLPGGQYQRLN